MDTAVLCCVQRAIPGRNPHYREPEKRSDPQKIPGAFRYEIRMTRFVRRGDGYARVPKTLEVVVREADWTILHFMYY